VVAEERPVFFHSIPEAACRLRDESVIDARAALTSDQFELDPTTEGTPSVSCVRGRVRLGRS
jgi:hypothetical protein